MFRCFFQPRSTSFTPKWLPSLNNSSSGSRGLLRLAEFKATTSASAIVKGPGLRPIGFFLRQLARSDIKTTHNNLLRPLKSLKKQHAIIIFIANKHIRSPLHDQYLSSSAGHVHAQAEALTRRYLRHHREKPLWRIMSVFCSSPIVRGIFRHRVLSAWQQALQNCGYDKNGGSLAQGTGAKELFGTVEFKSYEPLVALDTPFLKLRTHFEGVIKAIQPELGRPARVRDTTSAYGNTGTEAWHPRQKQQWRRPQDGRPANKHRHDYGGKQPPHLSQHAASAGRGHNGKVQCGSGSSEKRRKGG